MNSSVSHLSRMTVWGIPILANGISADQFAEILKGVTKESVSTKSPLVVFTPNPEQLVLAKEHPQFAQSLAAADVCIPDGSGLVWLMNKTATPPVQRIAGVDVVAQLLKISPTERFALIGGRGYGQKFAETNALLSLGNATVHWNAAYADVAHPTPAEEEKLTFWLKQEKPTVVFVAFGAPFQEAWALTHKEQLGTLGVKVVMVVGGSFDVLTGKVRRAPEWMKSAGLEWLFRLLQEPWRLGRQLKGAKFFWMASQLP